MVHTKIEALGRDFDEANDCSVRALASCLDVPYSECHTLLKHLGRKDRHCVPLFVIEEAGLTFKYGRLSLAAFVKEFAQGIYYVVTRNHAFAVKNGIVYDDRRLHGRNQVRAYAKVS